MKETRTCELCGDTFECEPLMIGEREVFRKTKCDDCIEAEAQNAEARERREQKAAEEKAWERVCPPLYRDTDPNRLPESLRKAIASWEHGPRGIGFSGEAGKGKTRAAFMILKRQHFRGKTCAAISMTRFAMACVDQFSDDHERRGVALDRLEELRRAKVLLLDDIGKSKMTERAEMEFFDLLEHRTSHLIPIIWTANASGPRLLAMLSEDRGEPIMRRLSEFSEIIS